MEFKMDNSGILHMAVRGGGRSNTFRLAVTLKDRVCPERLNEAFHRIAPRFPTIVAGIRNGFYHHYVVPAKVCPDVQPDYGTLMYMALSEIKSCAMRVYYSEYQIITEFFHSLTDGYGGIVFTKTLVAEYLGESVEAVCGDNVISEETDDSFMKFAGRKKKRFNNVKAYLPFKEEKGYELHTTTGIFDVEALLEQAHRHNISLTVFLTAVMSEALLEMQESFGNRKKRPVQIMVPVNLRNIFPSRTMRNFSLYALPRVDSGDGKSFAQIASGIEMQMKEQLSEEYLMAMMATNAMLERNVFMRYIPLKLKCAALKTGFFICGEKTSCLTLSNLGQVHFPESFGENVVRADFILSPRLRSAYNCGVITCGNKLYFNFSRSCREPVLEQIFFRRLSEMDCVPAVEIDGAHTELASFLKRKAKI